MNRTLLLGLRVLAGCALLLCFIDSRWNPAALRYDATTDLATVHADFLVLVEGQPAAVRLHDWLAQPPIERKPLRQGSAQAGDTSHASEVTDAAGLPVRVGQRGTQLQLHQRNGQGSRSGTRGVSAYRIEGGRLQVDYFLGGMRHTALLVSLGSVFVLLLALRANSEKRHQGRPLITPGKQ